MRFVRRGLKRVVCAASWRRSIARETLFKPNSTLKWSKLFACKRKRIWAVERGNSSIRRYETWNLK